MKTTSILLVGYSPIDSKIAAEIARVVFPRAAIKTVKTVEEAISTRPLAETELLILPDPTPAAVNKAVAANDETGLPRWAILVVGTEQVPLGVETISPVAWAGPATSHAFRSAIAQHTLRRDLARAQGDLLAIGVRVTHDLRTQVAAILATAELSKELLEDIEPAQTELYQPIFDSVDALGKIIERLSFITRASVNGAAKIPIEMKEVVKAALNRLNEDVIKTNASITQPGKWPAVNGVKPLLEKIWFSLLTNALAHAGPNPRIELGWQREKNDYRFWIRDEGKGVPASVRSGLFQPFHQLHHATGPRGMGLPIVHRLSELHGGRCGYEPRETGGSEFFFILPA